MPSFAADGIVEPIRVSFRPYADFDDDVTEPSDKQIGAFITGLKNLMTSAAKLMGVEGGIPADATPAEQAALLDQLDPDEFVKVMEEMAALHARLCSGHPSKTQILAVPIRIRLLFYTWLQGEVMSPEARPGAGTAQVKNLRMPAAG